MDINIGAVVVAAVTSFVLGGAWYSKALFGPAWGRAAGIVAGAKHGHPARVFGVSLVFCLIAALAFAWRLGPRPTLSHALAEGCLVGGCFVAACFGVNYQFADRRMTLWLIDGGYHTAQFVLFGLILGLWHS